MNENNTINTVLELVHEAWCMRDEARRRRWETRVHPAVIEQAQQQATTQSYERAQQSLTPYMAPPQARDRGY